MLPAGGGEEVVWAEERAKSGRGRRSFVEAENGVLSIVVSNKSGELLRRRDGTGLRRGRFEGGGWMEFSPVSFESNARREDLDRTGMTAVEVIGIATERRKDELYQSRDPDPSYRDEGARFDAWKGRITRRARMTGFGQLEAVPLFQSAQSL